MYREKKLTGIGAVCLTMAFAAVISCSTGEQPSAVQNPGESLYDLGHPIQSRSISFENPTGEPGEGGKTASKLGVGRKGFPAKSIAAGETVVLCDIQGMGTIRHIDQMHSYSVVIL